MNATAISTVSSSRRDVDMAVERRAIEVETTPMPVTPATAAEMKHWVSQVEAAGSDTAAGYTCGRVVAAQGRPPKPASEGAEQQRYDQADADGVEGVEPDHAKRVGDPDHTGEASGQGQCQPVAVAASPAR